MLISRDAKPAAGAARAAASLLAALVTMCVLALGVHVSPARAWTPEGAKYGVSERQNVPVTMSDGTVLRADVYTPTNPATGKPAQGPFPVLLTQTPYGKDVSSSSASLSSSTPLIDQIGENEYLIKRGYIDVVTDVRGTGDSGGQWGLFDPVQGTDGATLARWAAGLPHSDHTVGLYGASYLGINQFFTVGALGPNSPVKAMFPIVAGDDIYRDTAFDGGILDAEFGGLYLGGLTTPLFVINPVAEDYSDPFAVMVDELDHAQGAANFQLPIIADTAAGNTNYSYDSSYWEPRAPASVLDSVVKDHIPAFLVGGWFDLFQRGEPLNYSALQNLQAGRPELGPMAAHQAASARYQLMMGPWYHLTTGTGVDLDQMELRWFDRWLKDEHTGVEQTKTPVQLYLLGANRYIDVSGWPPAQLKPATWYLGAGPSGSGAPSTNDGSLRTTAPTTSSGQDTVAYVGADSGCAREIDQWSMGALIDLLGASNPNSEPCANNDATTETGPGALTYTTPPFKQDTVIGGPLDASLYATSTRPDTEMVATVEDVAPNGTATPLTTGALLGSMRATDPSRSWFAPDGKLLLPYHPYTQASQQPVPAGTVTRFDVEIRPTFAELLAGHRLRLTVTTSDLPALEPSAEQQSNLVGGIYEVQRNSKGPSYLEVSTAPATAFPGASVFSCPAPSGRLKGRTLGPVSLGMTRSRVRSRFISWSSKGRRYMDFFCSGAVTVGYASPKLARLLPKQQRRSTRGRAVLVVSSSAHYSLHGLRPGAKLKAARRLRLGKGFHLGFNWWYLVGDGPSRGVIEVRHGVVEKVGIADARLTRTRHDALVLLKSFF